MAKGIYQKWSYIYTNRTQDPAYRLGGDECTATGYTSYSFSSENGFKETGALSQSSNTYKVTVYLGSGRDISKYYWTGSNFYSLQMYSEIVKTTMIEEVILDYGSVPNDGYSGSYWYVFVKMASDLKINDNLVWRDAPTGYAMVDGIMRPQAEFKANINGIWK